MALAANIALCGAKILLKTAGPTFDQVAAKQRHAIILGQCIALLTVRRIWT